MTIRENSNDVSQFVKQDRERANLETHFTVPPVNNNIVEERIWVNPVISKIKETAWEPDTDGQLHEERVISVTKQAESASRVLHEKRPR